LSAPAAPRTHVAADGSDVLGVSVGSLLLAAAIPFVFLHVDHNPGLTLSIGSASGKVTLADAAIAAVVLAASVAAFRDGISSLRAGWPLWLTSSGLVAWVVVMTLWPGLTEDAYLFGENAVTALRFGQYALLALAVPLLVRRAPELSLLLWTLTVWCVVAVAVGVVQFVGVDVFDAWAAGWRQPSFLGHHDFAALGGAVLGAGVAGLLAGDGLPGGRRLAPVALAAGGLALALSGSVAGVAGLAAGGALAVVAVRRRARPSAGRLAVLATTVAVVAGCCLILRGGDLDEFLRFAGVREERRETVEDIQSYAHRSVLVYIGGRIFLDNPVAGLGWQASGEPWGFLPYVDDARRRFPNVAEESFPADREDREYGVQNAYVQALADLGVIGFALLAGTLVSIGAVAWRAVRDSTLPWPAGGVTALVTLCVAAGLWGAIGLVSAQPIDAVTWLAAGIAVAAARELPHD
jgi:hypothetical protein